MQTRQRSSFGSAGFTLVEIFVAVGVLAVMGTVAMSYLRSEALLFAKNVSLNQSHASVRSVLDRLTNELQQTQSPPILLDTTGAQTAVSPAAGLQFDHLVGDPYVLVYPGPPGLAAGDTSIGVVRSTDPLSSAPLPRPGDVFLIDPPSGSTIRAQVASITGTASAGPQRQAIALNLSAPLGTALDWRNPPDNPPQQKTVKLVRREAFIVMPSGGKNELRFYQSFEPLPPGTISSILNDTSQYVVITDAVSTAVPADPALPADATPFSIDTTGGNRLVKANLATQAQQYVNTLASNQAANSFNTFIRIKATLPSRQR
jgi:type II secretory pathway pseudopilin PulG